MIKNKQTILKLALAIILSLSHGGCTTTASFELTDGKNVVKLGFSK